VPHDQLTKRTELQTKTAESNGSPWLLCYGALKESKTHSSHATAEQESFTWHMIYASYI